MQLYNGLQCFEFIAMLINERYNHCCGKGTNRNVRLGIGPDELNTLLDLGGNPHCSTLSLHTRIVFEQCRKSFPFPGSAF